MYILSILTVCSLLLTASVSAQVAPVAPVADPLAPAVAPVSPPSNPAPAAAEAEPTAPPAPPAVVVLPPPPPGFTYAPVPNGSPSGAGVDTELAQIDARLHELQLQRAQYGIGGPIAMMGVGFGGALAFGYVAFLSWLVTSVDDIDGSEPSASELRGPRILLGFAVLGVGVGIGGSILLGRQLRGRGQFKPEIRELKLRKRELSRELRYSARMDAAGGLGFALSTRF